MTAEVAIMNQHALVLAADSALTVTTWPKGEKETRYFKGTNKLFQLSARGPVGLMIYGSASLHDVPWELLIKDFREQRGTESWSRVGEYASRFFNFVRGHSNLFPQPVCSQLFIDQITRVARLTGRMIASDPRVTAANEIDRPDQYRTVLQVFHKRLAVQPPEAPLTARDVDSAVATHLERATAAIRNHIARYSVPNGELAGLLAETALRDLMVNYKSHLPVTGVVIGGYGEDDYLPGYEAFECHGFLDRHFVCSPSDRPISIGKDLTAVIEPFATTSMINTFRLGIGPDILEIVDTAMKDELLEFSERLRQLLAPDRAIPDVDRMVEEAAGNHRSKWFEKSVSDHYGPLARVVGSLPVAEMAALAKSLIELQSLKERVTKPTESVSGPIDVAVISKHDGFVWIERKHYFNPELNPRFFLRQSSHLSGVSPL